MLGCEDAGFEAIHAMALNAAISGSTLADPEACFVTRMAFPFGSTQALPTAHAIRPWPLWRRDPSASLRSPVLTAPVSFQPWEIPTIRSFPLIPTSCHRRERKRGRAHGNRVLTNVAALMRASSIVAKLWGKTKLWGKIRRLRKAGGCHGSRA